MAVINVEHLNKSFKIKEKEKGFMGSMKAIVKPKYKEVHAVNDISFKVVEGEMIAFIGPNGAGKSTTIKMLTGILYPDSGSIEVLGINPSKARKKLAYEIGTVFGQKEQLWMHLTAYDNFKFFGAIYDISDIEKLCKRVVIINDGKIVMDDSMRNLKYHYMDKKVIEVKVKNKINFKETRGIKILKEKDKSLKIEIDTKETDLTAVLKLIDPENIIDINISNTPLEEIISEIYRKE